MQKYKTTVTKIDSKIYQTMQAPAKLKQCWSMREKVESILCGSNVKVKGTILSSGVGLGWGIFSWKKLMSNMP